MIYVFTAVGVYFLHVLLKLNLWTSLALGIYVFFMLPKHKKLYGKMQCNKQRFHEVSLYLDTVLYAFVKEEKVELAVRDAKQTLPEGHMKELVTKAHDYLLLTFDEVEVMQEAFSIVEKGYPCKRLSDVHKFMCHVEVYGGEIERPVSLLLADKNRWEKRTKKAMAAYKKHFTDVVLSVIASLFICGAVIYLPVTEADISSNWLLQIFTVLVLAVDDMVILKAQKMMARDWLNPKLMEEDTYYEKKMEEWRTYDIKKDKRFSLILGVWGMSLVLLAVFFGNEWWVVGALALTLLFFNQHGIGRSLMEKNLLSAIGYAFPNWLMDLVLLLQTENVQMALYKSKEYVPGVLRKELELLTERLELEPESSEPYHKFLAEFSIPEIHSAMGILYSLSIGNSGNADRQISELVDKNLEMLDLTEEELVKKSLSGMYVLFLVPVMTAAFKLVIDMVVLMLEFLQTPLM